MSTDHQPNDSYRGPVHCVMRRLTGGEALRTDSVAGLGFGPDDVTVGFPFILVAAPFDASRGPNAVREVTTSPVRAIERLADDVIVILTQSGSRYEIRYDSGS